jgi:hypothetical protein
MAEQHDWSRDDFGAAMERAVVQHGSPRCVKRRGHRIYTNGWWREGAHPNVVVNVSNASWFDFRTSETGGVSKFAQVAFGLRLPAFMERFGGVLAMEPAPPPPAPLPPREDIAAAWEKLEQHEAPAVITWLKSHRGVEPGATVSGFAELNVETVACFDDDLRTFASRIQKPAIILPMRDAGGAVRNMHIRPIGYGGRRFLPAPLSSERGPLAYGLVWDALDAETLVVVEGALDTLAAEAMLASEPDVSVLGVPSCSSFHQWATFLSRKQRGTIIVVPHLDPPPHPGQKAAAAMVAHLSACDIPARFFGWQSFHNFLGSSAAKDVADACRSVGFAAARSAFVRTIHGGIDDRRLGAA